MRKAAWSARGIRAPMTRETGGWWSARRAFVRVPGLGLFFRSLTRVVPLGRGKVIERDGKVFVTPKPLATALDAKRLWRRRVSWRVAQALGHVGA